MCESCYYVLTFLNIYDVSVSKDKKFVHIYVVLCNILMWNNIWFTGCTSLSLFVIFFPCGLAHAMLFGTEIAYLWSTTFAGSNSITYSWFLLLQNLLWSWNFDQQYWKRRHILHSLYSWCDYMQLSTFWLVPLHLYFQMPHFTLTCSILLSSKGSW